MTTPPHPAEARAFPRYYRVPKWTDVAYVRFDSERDSIAVLKTGKVSLRNLYTLPGFVEWSRMQQPIAYEITREQALALVPQPTAEAKGTPTLIPNGEPCRLADCPPGLFVHEGVVGVKTDFNCPPAFVIETGATFWGGAKSFVDRGNLTVQPVRLAPSSSSELIAEAVEAIRLSDAATPGEWWVAKNRDQDRLLIKYPWDDVPTWLAESSEHPNAAANFDFIARARTLLPKLARAYLSLAQPLPAPAASELAAVRKERDDYEKGLDETIGERDAYEEAVAKLDIATGGDGEYGYSSDGSLDDTPVAKCRSIEERFVALTRLLAESHKHVCSLLCPSVGKVADGPLPHVELCQRISAALASGEPALPAPAARGEWVPVTPETMPKENYVIVLAWIAMFPGGGYFDRALFTRNESGEHFWQDGNRLFGVTHYQLPAPPSAPAIPSSGDASQPSQGGGR